MTELFVRTDAARMAALQKANLIRFARAALKRNLRTGTASVLGVLLDPAPEFASMKVRNLLLALPKWGPSKVDRFMVTCRVSHLKTLAGMSSRQRGEMSALLRARGIQ